MTARRASVAAAGVLAQPGAVPRGKVTAPAGRTNGFSGWRLQ